MDQTLYPDGLLLLAASALLYRESTRTLNIGTRALCVGLSILCGTAGSMRLLIVTFWMLEQFF